MEKEDSLSKLVQYLDYEESEEGQSKNFDLSSSSKPTDSLKPKIENIEFEKSPKKQRMVNKLQDITTLQEMKNNIMKKTQNSKYIVNTFEMSNEKQSDASVKLDKENEHTFGQKLQNSNFDTIQIHDLKHFDLQPPETNRLSLEPNPLESQQKFDVQTVVDDSEAYFNSIINQMKKDLKPQVNNEGPPSGSLTAKSSIPAGLGLMNSRQGKLTKKGKKRNKRGNQTLIESNLDQHRSFLSKHSRTLSIKPALCDNKENSSINVDRKDLWYSINKVLERNGYSQISLTKDTSSDMVCDTILNILNEYEKRGQRLQELLLEKRTQQSSTNI